MQTKVIDLTIPEQVIEISEDTKLVALFIGKEQSQVKAKLNIVHRKPHLKSEALIKAVLYDQSAFDVEANLIIEKGATLTDTYLKIDVLMLSDKARARAVPSLEIMEDDVKGGHGATVGELDPGELFYITSRGISKDEATELIVQGFIGEVKKQLDLAN